MAGGLRCGPPRPQLDANPYHVGTAEAQAWQYGLIEGRAKRPKVVDEQ